MRSSIALALAAALIVVSYASNLQAQSDPPREDVMNRIETIRIWKLTELLNLSTEQGSKVFPIIQSYGKQLRTKGRDKEQIYRQLHQGIEDGKLDKATVTKAMQEVLALEQQAMQIRKAMIEALSKELTPEQLAKYIIFEDRYNDEIRDMIRDIRHERMRKMMHRKMEMPDDRGEPPPPEPDDPPPANLFEPNAVFN